MVNPLAAALMNQPLMMAETELDRLAQFAGADFSIDLAAIDLEAFLPSVQITESGIGILPVSGPLFHSASPLMRFMGASTYGDLSAGLRALVADPMVKHIVLNVNSGGGSVNGAFDFADEVHAARERKPITAIVDEHAYSAAYAIASGANRVVLSRTGGVGSIGVIARHVDQSAALEKEGIKVTAIYKGDHKNDFDPSQPLSDEARKNIQAQVNDTYDLFVNTVARNRGLDAAAVRDTQADTYVGEKAVAAGLADSVMTPAEAIAGIYSELEGERQKRSNTARARSVALRTR